MNRDYDLVIFGATGDAGRAMTALLADSAPPTLRWTIAGRSRSKLEALAPAGSKLEVLVADCADDAALLVLAARTLQQDHETMQTMRGELLALRTREWE